MKVFVSSTISDLRDFRAETILTLRTLGADVLNEPAENDPTNAALEQVAEAELFILLVAWRYGRLDHRTGSSAVEMEYREAQRRGVPVLAFLLSDDALWPSVAMDADRSRVSAFRTAIMESHTVAFFQSPPELATRVAAAVHSIISRRAEISPSARAPRSRIVRILRLLLSSPGDVASEREACSRAVFRFNQQSVEQAGIFIKLVRWEDMAPQIGPGPQNVINRQIGEYDLFCGIMWNRFGTPTDVAASGTEEEFRAAITCWEKDKRPWITFYFCDRPVAFANEQQLEQKRHVMRLRTELLNLGVVRNCIAVDEFENLLFQDLLRITALDEFQATRR